MIDPTRLDLELVQPAPADVRAGYAVVHHYFTGTPVADTLQALADDAVDRLDNFARRLPAPFAAHYYADAHAALDHLYQSLHDLEALLLIRYQDGEAVRCVTAYVSPGGLRCRDTTRAAEPVRPLTDLAALGPLRDALLCVPHGVTLPIDTG